MGSRALRRVPRCEPVCGFSSGREAGLCRSGDKRVLNNAVLAAACPSESLGSSRGPWNPPGLQETEFTLIAGLGKAGRQVGGAGGSVDFSMGDF